MNNLSRQYGFTLVELVTVVVLVGILSVLGGMMILGPIQSFTDVSRRAALTDVADNALQGMSRELRNALPNSIRISGTALEFLHTSAGGRYRARVESDGSGNPLVNSQTDTFDVIGGVIGTVSANAAATSRASCFNGDTDCLVIYNTGTGAGHFDAYAAAPPGGAGNGNNVAAISGATATTITFNNTANAGWSFPFPIPASGQQRFFVVDMPVSYVCDLGLGELWRYEDYDISSTQPVVAASFTGGSSALLAENVSACSFTYNPGAGSRHGLVTMSITIADAASGESVFLQYQTHVSNVP
jgi:MSHA biogenesis protein MshO